MTSSLDELLNAEFKEAFDEFDKVKKLFNCVFYGILIFFQLDSTRNIALLGFDWSVKIITVIRGWGGMVHYWRQ